MRSVQWLAWLAVGAVALAGCVEVPREVGDPLRAEPAVAAILLVVDDAPKDVEPFTFEGAVALQGESFTALDQLLAFAHAEGFEVETEYYDSFDATLVLSIHGLAGQPGPENGTYYYWSFLVNGAMSDTGADRVVLTDGDAAAWRYVLS